LLVCVNLASRQAELLRANGVLCVNVLAAKQTDISALFSTRDLTIEERYAVGDWASLGTGSPVLQDALASFDCQIVERLERGTHGVVFCEVKAVRVGAATTPLVYFGRRYLEL
jgi:flavin reductase